MDSITAALFVEHKTAVHIGELKDFKELVSGKVVVIFDTHIGADYLSSIISTFSTLSFPIEGGESAKTMEMCTKILSFLHEHKVTKEWTLFVLGGGSLLDLCGFVASIYQRGMSLVFYPSTLLAAIDAAYGGKNGVNFHAKNQIGTFYFPELVLCDLSLLRDFFDPQGLVEAYKHGLILDRPLFTFLKTQDLKQHLPELLRKNAVLKLKVVTQDPFERMQLRLLLNYGHTVAHCLEASSNYTIDHGTSVAFGMVIESIISHVLGYLSEQDLLEIVHILTPFCATIDIDLLNFDAVVFDKKIRGDQLLCVFLKDIGESFVMPLPYTEFVRLSTYALYLYRSSYRRSYCSSI